jgi:outer membrane autotransporter protein
MDAFASAPSTSGVATGSAVNSSSVWGQVFGKTADQDDRDGFRGYEADTGGVVFGADTRLSDRAVVGVSLAYANTSADSAHAESDIDSYQGSVYGVYDYGNNWFSNGLLGFTHNKYDTKRNIVVGAVSDQAKADFDGQQYTAKVGVGYRVKVGGGLNVTPVAGLRYSFITTDEYTETGSTANLHVDTDDINVFQSELGVKLAYPIMDGGITYTPRLSASWFYDMVGDEQESVNSFTGAPGVLFTTTGPDVAQHTFNVGLGLDILAQDNVTVSFDYNWTAREEYDAHSGALKARLAF